MKFPLTMTRIDPVLLLLFLGMLVFTGLLLLISKWSPNDGQTFQVISGLLTAFSGAFFLRIKPKTEDKTPPEPPGQ